jgi:thymidylate synthase
MHVFSEGSLDELYIRAVKAILDHGTDFLKGGRTIRELYPAVFVLSDPREAVLCVENRPYSPAFMVAEMLWNLTGDTRDWLCRYNPRYRRYFTGGHLLAGYGNRMLNWAGRVNQVEKVVTMLRERPETQHANIIIFDPEHDLDNPIFVPCITKLHFRIRQGRLHMSAYLRAQDLWLGFPYDIHLLLCIFQLVAARLSIEMGAYHHHCDVLRLYEQDLSHARKVEHPIGPGLSRQVDLKLDTSSSQEQLCQLRDLLINLTHDPTQPLPPELTKEEGFWQDALRCCQAYQLIHRRDVPAASRSVGEIRGILREVFLLWSATHHKALHIQAIAGD